MSWLIRLLIISLFVLSVLISGCSYSSETSAASKLSERELAANICISLCHEQKSAGTQLENGPCLSNEIIADWVCDVAHSPRQDIDNQQENQCPAFRERKAHHFVEVDPDCCLIKTY